MSSLREEFERLHDEAEMYGAVWLLDRVLRLIAAHPCLPSEAELAAAWDEAMRAIPSMYSVSVSRTSPSVLSGRYLAATDMGDPRHGYFYADTPEAALIGLLAALKENAQP